MKHFLVPILLFFSYALWGQSFSSLKVNLLTEGASVYLDNVRVNNGALANTLTITSGNHTISSSKEGCIPFRSTFYIAKGEHKILNISLDDDNRSTIQISSSSAGTIFKINGEEQAWNSETTFNKLIEPGRYEFSFYEYGKLEVSRNILIGARGEYVINLSLSESLPVVTPGDIGREIRNFYTINDFNKPETKVVEDEFNKLTMGVLCGFLGGAIAYAATKNSSNQNVQTYSPFGGFLLGAWLGSESTPVKKKNVPDPENIEYNKTTVPKMVIEKNSEVSRYNQETQRLIERRRIEIYNETALKIAQTR